MNPIVGLLKQGLTPEKLSISLSVGLIISCFPVLGSTTLLCAMVAHLFKLNHVAIQISNYVGYPMQLILLIPFFILGDAIFGYESRVYNISDMMVHFQIDTLDFFKTYIGLALRACVAWALCALPASVLAYFCFKFFIDKLFKKHVAVALLLVLFGSHALAETFKFSGDAKNLKGELVYTEKHNVQLENGKVVKSETLYYSKSGELIAELKSDYKDSIFLPEYTFKDLRSGIEHVVVREGKDLVLKSKENKSSEIKTKKINANDSMVSCQGFHYFIRDNLENFKKNEDRDIQLILPGLLDYFTFNIRAQDKKNLEGPVIKLKMTVNSWLLKAFVSAVEIEYDTVKKQLIRYVGASNILTDDGKTQDVEITYNY